MTQPPAAVDASAPSASMFTPDANAQVRSINPDPLAAQLPTIPVDNCRGSLAGLFVQQQAKRATQKRYEEQAEATRRAALFSPGRSAGLYG
ncbi:hypothetical protein [Rhizobium sp.]